MPNPQWVNMDLFEQEPVTAQQLAVWQDKKLDAMFPAFPLDKTKLKKIVVGGIPSNLRSTIYPKLLKCDQLGAYETDYKRAQARTHGLIIPSNPIPPTFGGRTQQPHLALTSHGQAVVNHVLCIISHDNPTLEFCPYLPPIVALLAHHIDTEDMLLACVSALLRLNLFTHPCQAPRSSRPSPLPSPNSAFSTSCPSIILTPSPTGPITSMPGESTPSRRWCYIPTHPKESKLFHRAFGNLLYKTDRSLHSHLTSLHASSPLPFWSPWLHNMFTGVFPQRLLWRFLDCFLVEGYKSLLRFGMASLLMFRDTCMTLESVDELDRFFAPHVFFGMSGNIDEEDLDQGPTESSRRGKRAKGLVDVMCEKAAAVFINYASVKRVHEHHASLAAVSQESMELLSTGESPNLKYQRALPKFVGEGVAAVLGSPSDRNPGGSPDEILPGMSGMSIHHDMDHTPDGEMAHGDKRASSPARPVSAAEVRRIRVSERRKNSRNSHRTSQGGSGSADAIADQPDGASSLFDDYENYGDVDKDDYSDSDAQAMTSGNTSFLGLDVSDSSRSPSQLSMAIPSAPPAASPSHSPQPGSVPNTSQKAKQASQRQQHHKDVQKQQQQLLPVSTIASTDYWIALWSWIPPQRRMDSIELKFTTNVHGYSLSSLCRILAHHKPIILAIETMAGETFGAYLSDGLPDLQTQPELSGKWVGSGETFLFSLIPDAKMFPWVGRLNNDMTGPSYFVNLTRSSLTIGGGG
ncbi:hypothetical protein BC831DRAFT_441638 [Entophlyctis helioformis]|nr:hypothetical protein BC831DRAFT_441638 [Entophlyctis helioformis]